MRTEVRRIRFFQELVAVDMADDIATLIARERKYRGLLADPPWPWNASDGKAGSNSPYYDAMSLG